MEIDDSEEVLLNERSRLMDEKVKYIDIKNDEKESSLLNRELIFRKEKESESEIFGSS